MVSTWSDCLRPIDMHMHDKKEPWQRYRGSDNRPGIAVFECGVLHATVTLTLPWHIHGALTSFHSQE